jgi:hypothetical protein
MSTDSVHALAAQTSASDFQVYLFRRYFIGRQRTRTGEGLSKKSAGFGASEANTRTKIFCFWSHFLILIDTTLYKLHGPACCMKVSDISHHAYCIMTCAMPYSGDRYQS